MTTTNPHHITGLSDTQDQRLRSVERLTADTSAALNDHLVDCAERSRATAVAVSELTVQVRHLSESQSSLNKLLLSIGLRVSTGLLLLVLSLCGLIFYLVTGIKP
jgi:hypothetical protein